MVGKGWGRLRLASGFGSLVLLTSAAGVTLGTSPAGATNPGINGKVACATNRDGNFEIYSFNPNGTELEATRLTNDPANDGRPRYSPDGRQIAFESNRSGSQEIWIMNADGSNPRRLTFSGNNSSPSWHPDGSQIVYQTFRNTFQIAKIFVDGTGETQLTFGAQESSLPTWSPDGTKIAFSSRTVDPAADVMVMNPDGSGVVDLTNSPGEDSWPSWSPDGTMIAFHSRREDASGEEIYRMNADGSNVVRLTFNNTPQGSSTVFDIFPAWSPDGTRILFNSGRGATNFGEIYQMSAITGDADIVRVTNNPAVDQRCDWQPLCTIYGSGDIAGTPGDDIICGSDGPDRIAGGAGNDRILGLGGDDDLSGGSGSDSLFGGFGNDDLSGGRDVDAILSGGPGDDRFVADNGERIDRGAGNDLCVIGGAAAACPPRIS